MAHEHHDHDHRGHELPDEEETTEASGWRAKIVVVSDRVAAGERQDRSGPALAEALVAAGAEVEDTIVVTDGREVVGEALVDAAEGFAGLIVTTGGTGFAPRDQTPEGTLVVLDRQAPGLAEAMRLANPLGRLSRAVAGTRGQALILNLPGSTSGALECLGAVVEVVPHALDLLAERPAGH